MTKETNSERLEADLRSTSIQLLEECDAQANAARDYAMKENDYRMAKAIQLLKLGTGKETGTVDYKKAQVDQITERERLAAHIAEGILDSTRERVRSLRAVLNAIQTIAGIHKVEANFDRTGPRNQ